MLKSTDPDSHIGGGYGDTLSAKSRYSRTVHASTLYNSAILSLLLTKCEASGNEKVLALLKKISSAEGAIFT
jgi:hypothetical protein